MSAFITKALGGLKQRVYRQSNTCIRNLTSTTTENSNAIEEDSQVREDQIEKVCNKSRLRPQHRNLLFDQRPYPEPVIKTHHTVKYNRKLYGKYGSASGVNPGIMWPTKGEVTEIKEFEKVAYPFTINEMVRSAKLEIEKKENEKLEADNRIKENMAKLEMWKIKLRDTIAKKQAEALAAKEKKEKLIEEVRRHFGFTVDPRDERFKEMLALKEKEMKKKEKKARMEEREKIAIAKLLDRHKSDNKT